MAAAPEILATIKAQTATLAAALNELRALGIVFPEIGLAETGLNIVSVGAGFLEKRLAGGGVDLQMVNDSYAQAQAALAAMNARA